MPSVIITSKKPVVILNTSEYQRIQDRLERLDFLESKTIKKDIAAARKALREGKTTSLASIKAKLLEG